MAGRQGDLLSRLADASERALQSVMSAPGTDRMMGGAMGVLDAMRQQLDAITNRVRNMDALERRLDELERRVDELSGTAAEAGEAASTAPAETAGMPGAAAATPVPPIVDDTAVPSA